MIIHIFEVEIMEKQISKKLPPPPAKLSYPHSR